MRQAMPVVGGFTLAPVALAALNPRQAKELLLLNVREQTIPDAVDAPALNALLVEANNGTAATVTALDVQNRFAPPGLEELS